MTRNECVVTYSTPRKKRCKIYFIYYIFYLLYILFITSAEPIVNPGVLGQGTLLGTGKLLFLLSIDYAITVWYTIGRFFILLFYIRRSYMLQINSTDGAIYSVYTLEQARVKTGLSWRKFCVEVGIPLSTYQLIEAGKRAPNLAQRRGLERYYAERGVTISFPNRLCTDFTLVGLRKWSGMRQEEVAGELGVSRSAYATWERGVYKPSFDDYWKLIEMYKYPLAQNRGVIENLTWGRGVSVQDAQ